jgi:membrane associated rhomboid family serine protease
VLGFLPWFPIAWQAHIGGLIVGAVIGFIFTKTRRPKQRWLQIGLLCLVGAVIVGALALPAFGVYAQLG